MSGKGLDHHCHKRSTGVTFLDGTEASPTKASQERLLISTFKMNSAREKRRAITTLMKMVRNQAGQLEKSKGLNESAAIPCKGKSGRMKSNQQVFE